MNILFIRTESITTKKKTSFFIWRQLEKSGDNFRIPTHTHIQNSDASLKTGERYRNRIDVGGCYEMSERCVFMFCVHSNRWFNPNEIAGFKWPFQVHILTRYVGVCMYITIRKNTYTEIPVFLNCKWGKIQQNCFFLQMLFWNIPFDF